MMTATTKQSHEIGQKSVMVHGRESSDLLYPMTPEEFTSQYWERRPVFIKGSAEKLEKLFPGGISREDFFRVARESARKQVKGFRIGAMKREWLGQSAMAEAAAPAATVGGKQPYVFIPAEQMEKMSAEGATLGADNFGDARFSVFIAALKTQLGHLGEAAADAFFSPGGDGFPPHIDRSGLIVVQLSGRKRWKISTAPVLAWPNGTTAFFDDGSVAHRDYVPEEWEEIESVDLANLAEFTLEPGDALYLPAGTIHATEAMDEHSFSISLLFTSCKPLDMLTRVLANRFNSDPAWRNVPIAHSANGSQAGELPAETKQFLAARLTELRAALETLTPESFDLNHEWHRLLADPGEGIRANLSLTSETSGTAGATGVGQQLTIQGGDVLRLSRRAPITYALGQGVDGDRCITAFYGDKEISVGGEWTPFLQTLIAQDEFIAESATRWADSGESYPWETVQEYLQALLEQGIIERAA